MINRSAKKSLGQHFLTDQNLLRLITEFAKISQQDTVIEIGPGRGSLTKILTSKAYRVIAVEIDNDLIEPLKNLACPNLEIIEADARVIDPEHLLTDTRKYTLVGNLPYYAAMPIIRNFFESNCRPVRSVFLLQKEVAQQVCARPGSHSLASISVQIFGTPRICKIVKPGSFTPAPKVTSAIVAIDSHDQYLSQIDNIPLFFRLLRAGFAAPRKQLRNSLCLGLSLENETIEELLMLSRINYQRRAETLEIQEWINLFKLWKETF